MREIRFSAPVHYLFAIGLVGGTTAVFFALRQSLTTPLVALLYLLPVGSCTALWGLGPGITSALCAFLAFNYFFIQPTMTMTVHRASDLVMLMVFLIVAVVISQLLGRAQMALSLARQREREAVQLYELGSSLAGVHDQQAVGSILCQQIQALFKGERVQLEVAGPHPFTLALPMAANEESRPPELAIPIETGSAHLGELQLWRASPALSDAEKRLLLTFTSQGALALERAGLAQAESRAAVLEESDRLKSAILSSVSHDLRTPLATIKAAVSSLRSGEVGWDSAARSELLEAMDEEADHLNLLVGNLLDMSRLEAGALKPQRQWNVLAEIVGSVLRRMRRLTADHQINTDISEDLPLVPVDYIQMEQVFSNLLSNSVKYAPPGTVIRLQARIQDPDWLLVQVINQGPPVPGRDLNRIFDKFYRITAADRVTGIGLGLSICKGIVEAHGGKIWANNLEGGFAFNFTLPLTWRGAAPAKLPQEAEEA
jgi:two-component system sensor histidine kinase KdpD